VPSSITASLELGSESRPENRRQLLSIPGSNQHHHPSDLRLRFLHPNCPMPSPRSRHSHPT
jgi:hypothetical protein